MRAQLLAPIGRIVWIRAKRTRLFNMMGRYYSWPMYCQDDTDVLPGLNAVLWLGIDKKSHYKHNVK